MEAAVQLRAEGYVFFPSGPPGNGKWVSPAEQELLRALNEAVAWARRPSPIPVVPFDEFLQRMGKLGAGPSADKRWLNALGIADEETL